MISLIDYEIDIVKVLLIFYLLIFSSQIHNIFTSLKINLITTNIVFQYILIFLVFFFLVSSISSTEKLKNINPIQKLIYSIFYFILFIFTLKINNVLRNIIIILLSLSYFLDMIHDHYYSLIHKTTNRLHYWFTWKYPTIKLFPVKIQQINVLNQINIYLIYIIYSLFIIGIIFHLKNWIFKNSNYKNYLNYK